MHPRKMAVRAPGYRSNAGAIADHGKYRHTEEAVTMQVLTNTPDGQTLLVTGLRACLERGQRILTVGSPPGTFQSLSWHPYALFWPSSEKSSKDGTRVVPAEVGAVLLTNMLSHELSRNVRYQAKARNLLCPSTTLSPGAAMRALNEALQINGHTKEEGDIEMALTKVTRINQQPAGHTPVLSMSAPEPTPEPPSRADTTDAGMEAVLKLVDESIAGLQLARENILGLQAEVALVRAQGEKLRLLRELLK